MIKVGLVGFGLSGRYLQAPFFEVYDGFRLSSIVTTREIPSELFPNAKRCSSFEDLLADSTLDLISICSPSHTHYTYAIAALKAGKHILIEKPMAASTYEAQSIFELAKSLSLHVFIFHNRRYDSDFLTFKSVINSGKLGSVHTIECFFDRYKPILNPKKWKEIQDPSNGILYDLGSHMADQIISLFGKPDSVTGSIFTQRIQSEIDDAFDMTWTYGKLRVRLASSLLMKITRPRFSIYGSGGSFVKYGIDVQEDHLVAGIWPLSGGFGLENPVNFGRLNYEDSNDSAEITISSLPGKWMELFNNIYHVIENRETKFFKDQEIIDQIEILEKIKNGI